MSSPPRSYPSCCRLSNNRNFSGDITDSSAASALFAPLGEGITAGVPARLLVLLAVGHTLVLAQVCWHQWHGDLVGRAHTCETRWPHSGGLRPLPSLIWTLVQKSSWWFVLLDAWFGSGEYRLPTFSLETWNRQHPEAAGHVLCEVAGSRPTGQFDFLCRMWPSRSWCAYCGHGQRVPLEAWWCFPSRM